MFSITAGHSAPLVLLDHAPVLCTGRVFDRCDQIQQPAISVVRVVVVDVARRVHVPRIVSVATIRTPQTDVLRIAYSP